MILFRQRDWQKEKRERGSERERECQCINALYKGWYTVRDEKGDITTVPTAIKTLLRG